MDDADRRTLENLVGAGVLSAHPRGGGFTAARCWSVVLTDGRSVFAKFAGDDESRDGNRIEAIVLGDASSIHLATLVAIAADGCLLVTDDLSDGDWTPEHGGLDGLWTALDELGSHPAPHGLPTARQGSGREAWTAIVADPRLAGAIGVAPTWLDDHLAALAGAAIRADTTGDRLVHLDPGPGNWVRAADGRWLLIDWASAHLGNPLIDAALASIRITRVRGEPTCAPRLAERPEFAALVGGWLAADLFTMDWAAAPPIAREHRIADIRAALVLVAHELDLQPP